MENIEPNNDEVICPSCAHQFRAIPVNVQTLLTSACIEPPFASAHPTPTSATPECEHRSTTGNGAGIEFCNHCSRNLSAPTSAAEGVQSIDTPGFRMMLADYRNSGALPEQHRLMQEVIAHIDTKMAEQRNEGAIEGRIHQRGVDAERIDRAAANRSKATVVTEP